MAVSEVSELKICTKFILFVSQIIHPSVEGMDMRHLQLFWLR